MSEASSDDPEELFAELVIRFAADPAVTPPSSGPKFGASALKVDGKIFAMLSGETLVVKLPKSRVDELIAAGTGRPFDAGRGRVMKEWAAIPSGDRRSWERLADEARRFVGGSVPASSP